jgi:hypothetical protein
MSYDLMRARARSTFHLSTPRLVQFSTLVLATLPLAVALFPANALACACGCGIFDIGNLLPTVPGGAIFQEFDYMNQSKNWSGLSHAPAANNSDKDIRTDFYTTGFQYLFDSGFGVMAELPYWDRSFTTDTDSGIATFNHSALGDVRLTGSYSGFSSDNSTGISIGVKLPTGDYTYPNFDRDTEIGSGSTDLSFGAYHVGSLDALGEWRYFTQARYQGAASSTGGYRPGNELDAVAGVSYDAGGMAGMAGMSTNSFDFAPTFQILASTRMHDSGPAANPANSGYSRLLLSPGIDVSLNNWMLHAEVDLPVYQNVVGNQLTAPVLFKTNLSYNF